jgi:hypothetical protein
MTTQTRPDVDLLESLDFEPVCEYGNQGYVPYYGGVPQPPCDAPATWSAVKNCCGRAVLWCDNHLALLSTNHHGRKWVCRLCGKIWPPGTPPHERYARIERIR